MKLLLAGLVPILATSQVAAAEIWECNHPNRNNEPLISNWTIEGNTLTSIYKGAPVVIGGQKVDLNTLFNNVRRVLNNDEHGLIAVLTLVQKTQQGPVNVQVEILLLNKETGDSRIVRSSTDPSDTRQPVYGKCRKLS